VICAKGILSPLLYGTELKESRGEIRIVVESLRYYGEFVGGYCSGWRFILKRLHAASDVIGFVYQRGN
jgi:hypothetical protein